MSRTPFKIASIALLVVACLAAAPSLPAQPRSLGEIPTAIKTNPIDGAEMIYIPPGPFLMGDADDAAHYFADNPRHSVTLSGYYIYKNDVTVAMYQKFCTADRLTPSREAA